MLSCKSPTSKDSGDIPTYLNVSTENYSLDNNGDLIFTDFSIDDFEPSINCKSCHLNQYQEWSESMHAYAMKDPVFFSGWAHAQEHFPLTGERFCTQCHSPVAFLTGEDLQGFSNADDFLSAGFPQQITEGVSCDICHTTTSLSSTIHTEDNVAAVAKFHLNPGKGIKYGSIENPEFNPYHDSEYNPIFKRSELCLPCHDLTMRGIEAEITFTEWNRVPGLSMSGALSCQDCHMPEKPDGTHDHSFIGVDLNLQTETSAQKNQVVQMLKSAISLQFGYPNVELPDSIVPNTQLVIPITINSLTAHSIPSGTSFSREAWIEIIVTDNEENVLYESGVVANTESLLDNDSDLLLFTSTIFDQNGYEVSSITQTHSMINNSLPAFGERYHSYNVLIPILIEYVDINIRMLFRSFKPHLLIENHSDLLENLPIIEMANLSKRIYIAD